MAIERKDRIVRYDILEYFKRAQDALNRRLYALKRELQALADKYSRLDTVETGAQVNIINGVKVKNEDIVSVNNKIATIDLGDYTKNEVTEVLKAKLDGIHEFASEVVVNPQCEDGVTLAHISVNGDDKFIKRGVIEYGELENVPETFPPSPHTHDDRYYTASEVDSKLSVKSDITHLHDNRYYTEGETDTLLSQKSDIGHTHSQYLTAGSMLNTANLQGIISVDNLPVAALERLVNVADDTARFALTEASVQLGDTVKVANTGLMYIIKDISKLNSEAGYEVYTAGSASSVPWSGVTGKPSSYTPSAHTHDDRYYTESEINSKVNTINSSIGTKADKTHTHDDRYYTESEIDSKLAGKQGSLTATGSATKGMYIDSSGTAKAMTYSVNKDVPSDAKFTDTVYTHPTTAGNKHIPSGGSSGQILRWSADGTAVWGADNNTTYSPATQSANGLMSAADKKKLDGIATGANAYTHPNSGVTAGTYRSVTVNAQGHVTGGSNPTTLSGYGITDAPTKTGGGASGTWGINISGKANTAGTADTSKACSGNSATSTKLNSRGRQTAITAREEAGMYTHTVYNNGYPVLYGNVITVGGDGGGQLLLEWSGADKGIGHVFYRNRRDCIDSWSGWRTVAFTTDNVASATKLQTARTINGTSFDGSGNITTANWGTARNISIADSSATNTGSAVSVNGSGNATLKLPATIKANITGNCSGTATNITQRKSASAVTHADYSNNQAYVPDMSFMAFWNGAYNSGGNSNLTYSVNGTIIGSKNIGSQTVAKANKLTDYAIPSAHDISTSATVYIFLGTWSGTSDSYSLILDIYTGEGWNALASQNDHISLFVKDSWQSTASATSAFGGVAHRYSPVGRNANNFSVALYATAANSVNVYLVVSPNIYSGGFYTVSMHGGTWTHKGTGSTSAPGGTKQECINYDIMLTQKDSSGNIIIS